MKPGQLIRTLNLLGVGLFLTFTVSIMAQVQSATTTTHGPSTYQVEVQRGEVVYVSGHEVVVKMEDGELTDFPNVPESAKVTVDGKEIGIHEVKVGMKLEKTITTTTTPRLVTTVETVTGKVFHVTPPLSVILTLENGENQQFKIPEDQKFNVDGQMVDAWGLRKGMKVTATRITEVPETIVNNKVMLAGKMPPSRTPPSDVPILVAVAAPTLTPPTEAPVAPAAAPAAEPATAAGPAAPEAPNEPTKTGRYWLFIGLLAAVVLLAGLGLRVHRRSHA